MRTTVALLLLTFAAPLSAQVYRWVDAKGTVHYSNAKPPAGVKATVRMEQRLARREELETRLAAERAAAAPRRPRGLDFRDYISLHRGMSEGELVTIAGAPDLLFSDVFAAKAYTYLPTPADPFTTTITVIGGRINHIERVRKF